MTGLTSVASQPPVIKHNAGVSHQPTTLLSKALAGAKNIMNKPNVLSGNKNARTSSAAGAQNKPPGAGKARAGRPSTLTAATALEDANDLDTVGAESDAAGNRRETPLRLDQIKEEIKRDCMVKFERFAKQRGVDLTKYYGEDGDAFAQRHRLPKIAFVYDMASTLTGSDKNLADKLNGIMNDFCDMIAADNSGKSVFGIGKSKNHSKTGQALENLEKKLTNIVKHAAGNDDIIAITGSFADSKIYPKVIEYIEQEVGAKLSGASLSKVMDLLDKEAKAVLDKVIDGMINSQQTTAEIMHDVLKLVLAKPELLRDIVELIIQDPINPAEGSQRLVPMRQPAQSPEEMGVKNPVDAPGPHAARDGASGSSGNTYITNNYNTDSHDYYNHAPHFAPHFAPTTITLSAGGPASAAAGGFTPQPAKNIPPQGGEGRDRSTQDTGLPKDLPLKDNAILTEEPAVPRYAKTPDRQDPTEAAAETAARVPAAPRGSSAPISSSEVTRVILTDQGRGIRPLPRTLPIVKHFAPLGGEAESLAEAIAKLKPPAARQPSPTPGAANKYGGGASAHLTGTAAIDNGVGKDDENIEHTAKSFAAIRGQTAVTSSSPLSLVVRVSSIAPGAVMPSSPRQVILTNDARSLQSVPRVLKTPTHFGRPIAGGQFIAGLDAIPADNPTSNASGMATKVAADNPTSNASGMATKVAADNSTPNASGTSNRHWGGLTPFDPTFRSSAQGLRQDTLVSRGNGRTARSGPGNTLPPLRARIAAGAEPANVTGSPGAVLGDAPVTSPSPRRVILTNDARGLQPVPRQQTAPTRFGRPVTSSKTSALPIGADAPQPPAASGNQADRGQAANGQTAAVAQPAHGSAVSTTTAAESVVVDVASPIMTTAGTQATGWEPVNADYGVTLSNQGLRGRGQAQPRLPQGRLHFNQPLSAATMAARQNFNAQRNAAVDTLTQAAIDTARLPRGGMAK